MSRYEHRPHFTSTLLSKVRPVLVTAIFIVVLSYRSGQVPVGQKLVPSPAEVLRPMENVEKCFCRALLPHCSQRGTLGRVPLCRSPIVCPHRLHLYSNIGIVSLLVTSRRSERPHYLAR